MSELPALSRSLQEAIKKKNFTLHVFKILYNWISLVCNALRHSRYLTEQISRLTSSSFLSIVNLYLDYNVGRRMAANIVMGVRVRLEVAVAAITCAQAGPDPALALSGYGLSHHLSGF